MPAYSTPSPNPIPNPIPKTIPNPIPDPRLAPAPKVYTRGWPNPNPNPNPNPHPIPNATQANHGDEEETKLAYIGLQGEPYP